MKEWSSRDRTVEPFHPVRNTLIGRGFGGRRPMLRAGDDFGPCVTNA